jgi:RNA polymerase sigma-70 factor (ECF subfamily)
MTNSNPPPIDQWLVAARAGSNEALGEAFEHCRRYLLTIANRELDADLRAKGGASDLVQETFADAQKLFDRFDGASDEEWQAWLRQLLIYNIAGFTRRFRTGKRSAGREAVLPGAESAGGWSAQLAADTAGPSAIVRGAEEAAAVERAVARLPEDYRQVLRWRYQEDLSFEEIAARLGRTANAARKLWVRAIGQLQAQLKATS